MSTETRDVSNRTETPSDNLTGWAAKAGDRCGCDRPRYYTGSTIWCRNCGWEVERWTYDQLWPHLRRRDRGKSIPRDADTQLAFQRPAELDSIRRYGRTMETDRRRRVADLRRHGQLARDFYARPAHGGHDVYADVALLGANRRQHGGVGQHQRTPGARPVRRRGSRRAGSSSRSSSQDPGGEGSDESDLRRPCPEGCGGTIRKPARGPWPARCAECKRAADAERKRATRAADERYKHLAALQHQVEADARRVEEQCPEPALPTGCDHDGLHSVSELDGDWETVRCWRCGDELDRRRWHRVRETHASAALVTPEHYAALLERFGSMDRVGAALRELPRAARRQRDSERLRALVDEAVRTVPTWAFAPVTNAHETEREPVVA